MGREEMKCISRGDRGRRGFMINILDKWARTEGDRRRECNGNSILHSKRGNSPGVGP